MALCSLKHDRVSHFRPFSLRSYYLVSTDDHWKPPNPHINNVVCGHLQSNKKLSPWMCRFPAETKQSDALPFCFNSHTIEVCPFCCLFNSTFYPILCFLLVILLFKMALRYNKCCLFLSSRRLWPGKNTRVLSSVQMWMTALWAVGSMSMDPHYTEQAIWTKTHRIKVRYWLVE